MNNPKASENLISLADRPEEERRAIAKKGAEKSKEARALARSMREEARATLEAELEFEGQTATIQKHGMSKTALKWIKDGDIRAGEFLRDTSGQKPTERVEQELALSTLQNNEERDKGNIAIAMGIAGLSKDVKLARLFDKLCHACDLLGMSADEKREFIENETN